MAIYAIGDVQGCFTELEELIVRIRFRREEDELWFVGDLVNRGPRSLKVLRFVKELGNRAVTVLGNHDLHLLSCAFGLREKASDTFTDVLSAPDRDELIAWLARQPLLHREGDYVLVHAGLHPTWDARTSEALADEVERALAHDLRGTLATLRAGDPPPRWDPALRGGDRLRAIVAVLTRIRTCTADGTMDTEFSGPPREAPHGCRPWFEWPGRYAPEVTVVCGHWAALGRHIDSHVVALDSGCVWGGALSAVRLDDGRVFEVEARRKR